jgi:hypothetical protein
MKVSAQSADQKCIRELDFYSKGEVERDNLQQSSRARIDPMVENNHGRL